MKSEVEKYPQIGPQQGAVLLQFVRPNSQGEKHQRHYNVAADIYYQFRQIGEEFCCLCCLSIGISGLNFLLWGVKSQKS